MRAAQGLFAPGRLEGLLGPLAAGGERTVQIALDWLRRGGKRLRPFVTLAAYRAAAGGADLPEPLAKLAVAIELFHKASLIHDDLEDGDELRYGRETVHAAHGDAAAINVGDFLVGLGYSLALGAVREIAGSGSLFGTELFPDGFQDWVMMILPSGGFFTLAGWLLLFNWLRQRRERTTGAEEATS